MKPTDFAYHLTNYLSKYLPGQRNVSINTIKSYRDTFALLILFCKSEKQISSEKFSLQNFNNLLIEDFLNWIETKRKCGISTRNQRLAAIHAFCKYMQYECPEKMLNFHRILGITSKKKPAAIFGYLTLDGVQLILEQPDLKTLTGIRDLTLLALMYDAGARVQEIADITIGDVRLSKPPTLKLIGKGNKARIVPLMERTALLLQKYISSLHNTINTDPLFFNRDHEKLTRSGISYILEKYVNAARAVKNEIIPLTVTPHTLRHSKAMHLLQSGVNLIYIRDLLGHTDIKTTEIYARADADMKRIALEKASHPTIPSDIPVWQESSDLLSWLQNLGTQK